MSVKQNPFIPAQAVIQKPAKPPKYFALGPRLRGDERIRVTHE
jgi:hypothetical protein